MAKDEVLELVPYLLSDSVLFWVLQGSLMLLGLFATLRSLHQAWKAQRGGIRASIERGEKSIGLFFGAYAAVSGLLVAICLSVNVVEDHRVLWVVTDVVAVAYLCLFNPWFRNRLVGWVNQLAKREKD